MREGYVRRAGRSRGQAVRGDNRLLHARQKLLRLGQRLGVRLAVGVGAQKGRPSRPRGGDRGGHRLGEARGSFPVLARRIFPRDGGEGEGGRAEPGADDLGLAQPRAAARGRGAALAVRKRKGNACTRTRDASVSLRELEAAVHESLTRRALAGLTAQCRSAPTPTWTAGPAAASGPRLPISRKGFTGRQTPFARSRAR
jgi:hypothetical protein